MIDEAAASLRSSAESWEKYCASHRRIDGTMDARLGDYSGGDVSDRLFESCDLSGSNFRGANLDRCIFTNCVLDDVVFADVSLVGAEFRSCRGKGSTFANAVVRSAQFTSGAYQALDLSGFTGTEVTFSGVQLIDVSAPMDATPLRLKSVQFRNCELRQFRVQALHVDALKLTGSTVVDIDIRRLTGSGLSAQDCEFVSVAIGPAAVLDVVVRASRVSDLMLSTPLEYADLSDSHIDRVSALDLGPSTANLTGARFSRTTWPESFGTTTLLGRFIPGPALPATPVQDIQGLTPILRRHVADAQYLAQRIQAPSSLPTTAWFRVWGLTTDFGRSLTRFVIFTIVVYMTLALAVLNAEHLLFGWHMPNVKILGTTLEDTFLASLGISTSSPLDIDGAYIRLSRVFAFFDLGVWISFAATRIARLSSQ